MSGKRKNGLEGIADRFLDEAIRNLMNGVLSPSVSGKRYLITSSFEAIGAYQGAEANFGFCAEDTLTVVKERLEARIAKANVVAKNPQKCPYPVEFKSSMGRDHIILWFERLKSA